MSERLTIANWSPDDQPREKLRDRGPQALNNAELLAILVGSGYPGVSAVELMQKILTDCGNNLNTLGKMAIHDLMKYKAWARQRPSPFSPPANWGNDGRWRSQRNAPNSAPPRASTTTCTP